MLLSKTEKKTFQRIKKLLFKGRVIKPHRDFFEITSNIS